MNAVVHDETIWLTQKAMAEHFGVNVPAISKHLKNIFAEEEYSKFNKKQEGIVSDFDKEVQRILEK